MEALIFFVQPIDNRFPMGRAAMELTEMLLHLVQATGQVAEQTGSAVYFAVGQCESPTSHPAAHSVAFSSVQGCAVDHGYTIR
jgi:hypothetical protein